MTLYRKLIRPMHCYPGHNYEPLTEPVEKEEKWYPEEEREFLEKKYASYNEGSFSDLVFEQKFEPYALELLKDQEPDASKFQYKYDHTDCLWYRDSRSKCPVTCSQYRDGWNDAMIFVFKNGAGYSPYKRR